MPFSTERRIQLAEKFYAIGPRNLTTNPNVRQMLDAYVQTGDLSVIANDKLRKIIARLEDLQLDEMTPQQQEEVIQQGAARIATLFVRDPEMRDFISNFVAGAPMSQDQDQIQDYATDSIMGFMKSQAGPEGAGNVQMSWDAMQQTMAAMNLTMGDMDFSDPAFQTAYFTNTVQRQYPHLTPAETHRAVEELRTISIETGMWGNQRRSIIPEGCVLPLTFLAVIGFLYAVMGLLLLAMLGTVALPAFWQTEAGQALNATLFLIGLIAGLTTWLRRQGIRSGLLRLVLGGVLIAGVGLMIVQLLAIDTDALAETATTDGDQTVALAVFGLSVLVSGFLWLRARTLNLITISVLLVLIVLIIGIAQQSGILDLTEINLNFLNDTTTDTVGFE